MPSSQTDPNFTDPNRDKGSEYFNPPKYYWLKHILREKILHLNPDDAMPSEAELCAAYKISRTTVRKAIGDLIQEGLIYSVQGRGSFVSPRKVTSAWVQKTGGLHADMTERGISVTMRVLFVGVIPAEENIQKELHLSEGETVVKLVRLRFVDDKPFDVVTNYVSTHLFPGLENEDFEHNSLYSIMRGKYGARFEHGVRTVEAGACLAEEARLLQIKAHSPILIMHSTMYDDRGIPVEHGIAHQRSDISQIVINVIPS